MTDIEPDEPAPGYAEWEQWWMSLSDEERAREIRLMDEHVAFWAKEDTP